MSTAEPGSFNPADMFQQLNTAFTWCATQLAAHEQARLFLVVVPDAGTATCETYDELDVLLARVAELRGQRCQAFIFNGVRWRIQQQPHWGVFDGNVVHPLDQSNAAPPIDDSVLYTPPTLEHIAQVSPPAAGLSGAAFDETPPDDYDAEDGVSPEDDELE